MLAEYKVAYTKSDRKSSGLREWLDNMKNKKENSFACVMRRSKKKRGAVPNTNEKKKERGDYACVRP